MRDSRAAGLACFYGDRDADERELQYEIAGHAGVDFMRCNSLLVKIIL